jgi:hypothetical protein
MTGNKHCVFVESPHPKTRFGPDRKKQGCRGYNAHKRWAVIPPRGKRYTDATMVRFSPFESLVLEAV